MVTVTSTVPAECAGELAVIWVLETTVKLETAVAPKATAVAVVKPVPVMVTEVPPAVGPALGATELTVGAATYVKSSAGEVADVPPAVVTVTFTVAGACAGEVAVIWVSETTVKEEAAVVLKLTAVAAVKPVPVMVTEVPPPVGPALGVTELTVGTGAIKVKWSAEEVAEVPPVVVTVTSTVAAACAGEGAVIWVAETTVKLEAAVVPKWTAVAPVKLVPVMVTEVPPAVGPEVGAIEPTVGAATKVNLSAEEVADVPPAVVTVTFTVAAACAGEVAVIWVSETTAKVVAAVKPKSTAVAAVKPVPVMVTGVPPAAGPALGATELTVGTGAKYLKWSDGEVAEVPPGVMTVTSTVPGACAGEVAVIWVAETTVKLEAAVAPKWTAVAPVKPVPVMVTEVPPAVGPVVGATELTVGAATKVKSSAEEVAEVPPAVVTVTSTVAAECDGEVAVIWESETTVKVETAVAPKWIAVAAVKPVPVMVTEVPPPAGPALGATELTVGTGAI